jgi:hypothetical protein
LTILGWHDPYPLRWTALRLDSNLYWIWVIWTWPKNKSE